MTFENYKLCPDLNTMEICIVLEQYQQGSFDRLQHLHVPKSRMSKDKRLALLESLVCRFNARSGLGFDQIVANYLNKRGKAPAAENSFQVVTTNPEPGVLRTYCGTDTKAWTDEVISSSNFRMNNKEV